MCGKNHTHDSSGDHCQFPHMFGFYHTCGSFGNQWWFPHMCGFYQATRMRFVFFKIVVYFWTVPFPSILIWFSYLNSLDLWAPKQCCFTNFVFGTEIQFCFTFCILMPDLKNVFHRNEHFQVQQGNIAMAERDKLEGNDSGETQRGGRFLFWCCEDK